MKDFTFITEDLLKVLIQKGNINGVKSLLKETPGLIEYKCEKSNQSLLHIAAMCKEEEILKLIFSKDSDGKLLKRSISDQDNHGKTLLHYGTDDEEILNTILGEAKLKGCENLTDVIHLKCNGKNVLHYAIQKQNHHLIFKYFKSDDLQINIDELDNDNQNYFHYFCNHFPDCKQLKDFIKSSNIKIEECHKLATSPTTKNRTPIFIAIEKQDVNHEFLKYLLSFCTMNDLITQTRNKGNNTPIVHAIKYMKDDSKLKCVFNRLRELKCEDQDSFDKLEWCGTYDGEKTILNVIFELKKEAGAKEEILEILFDIMSKERFVDMLKKTQFTDDMRNFHMICKISGL